jgi:hypothetical protein
VTAAEKGILAFMGDERAVLSPVQDGGIWLVQITSPTGEKSYVGKFSSENDAIKWMHSHTWWLIEPITENPTSESSESPSAA